MRRLISRRKAIAIGKVALAQGAALSVPVITWDASSNCENPVLIQYEGRVGTRKGDTRVPTIFSWVDGHGIFIDMKVSCRTKCEPCLKRRSYRWAISANAELELSQRTWLVTMTMKPEYLVWCRLETQRAFTGDIDIYGDDLHFRHLCRVIGKDLTLYLKRLRKRLYLKAEETGYKPGKDFRYLVVFEKHKSGEPHIHMFVHEQHGHVPVLWDDLVRTRDKVPVQRWPHGHTEAHLVTERGKGWYIAKYLSKEAAARVRASKGYFRKQPETLLVSGDTLKV